MYDSYIKNYLIFLYKNQKKLNISLIIICFLKALYNFTYLERFDLEEIFNGAYCIIKNDGGVIYNVFKKYCYRKCLYLETSLHKSRDIGACGGVRLGSGSIYFNGINSETYDLLLGLDKNGDTWFQFEKSRIDTIYNSFIHINFMFVYLLGKFINCSENIGPFGYSKNTSKNPLILKFR